MHMGTHRGTTCTWEHTEGPHAHGDTQRDHMHMGTHRGTTCTWEHTEGPHAHGNTQRDHMHMGTHRNATDLQQEDFGWILHDFSHRLQLSFILFHFIFYRQQKVLLVIIGE